MISEWTTAPGADDERVKRTTGQFTGYGLPAWPQGGNFGYGASAPAWIGGDTLDLDLGAIAFGESVSFTLYYGVAADKAAAQAAVDAVDADVSCLVCSTNWQYADEAVTGIFAYRATTPTT